MNDAPENGERNSLIKPDFSQNGIIALRQALRLSIQSPWSAAFVEAT